MRTIRLSIVFLGLALVSGTPATAGLVDSPLPTFGSGVKAKHVFSVPGVMSTSSLVTVFICTNLDKKNVIQFGVEAFFPGGGAPLGFTQKTLVVGGTGVISTNALNTYLGESAMILVDSPQARSARILATSTKIMCSATVIGEPADSFPKVAWDLPLIRKKQSGD